MYIPPMTIPITIPYAVVGVGLCIGSGVLYVNVCVSSWLSSHDIFYKPELHYSYYTIPASWY